MKRANKLESLRHGRYLLIAELLSLNLLPIIEIVHELSKNDAAIKEISYISQFGRIDLGTGRLTNRTRGGEWINDCPRTPEWLSKMSISNKIAQNTPETKLLKSIALKGQKRTAEQSERIKHAQLKLKAEGHGRAQRCVVDGVEYLSKRDAQRAQKGKRKPKIKIIEPLEKNFIENILFSGIQLAEYGWVGQAAAKFNISNYQARLWLSRHFPDVYEKSFKRK
jgi:hypothetical protein